MKIRYYGHAGLMTGYGRAAEGMILALQAAGADVELRTLAPYDSLNFEHNLPVASLLMTDEQLDPSPDAVIVHTLPGDCPRVMDLAAPHIKSRATWVAYTTFEAARAPDSIVAPFAAFDEVWHPSVASQRSFESNAELDPQRVQVIPHAFDEAKLPFYRERIEPADRLPIGKVYRFYSIGAWNLRKNPIGVIRAFIYAFNKTDDVELVLSCQGMTPEHLTQAIVATGFHPDQIPTIRAEFRPLTESQLWDLHRAADCFVSASRGEAWNLPAFEALLAGRHVIAPAGLGSDEYLADTSAWRIAATPSPALLDLRLVRDDKGVHVHTVGAQGLTGKTTWLEPSIFDLAINMRDAHHHHLSTSRVNYDIRRFGYKQVGELALERLHRLRKERP